MLRRLITGVLFEVLVGEDRVVREGEHPVVGILEDGIVGAEYLRGPSGADDVVEAMAVEGELVAALGLYLAQQRGGVVGDDVEETIRNVGRLASEGMKETNDMIIDIMIGN